MEMARWMQSAALFVKKGIEYGPKLNTQVFIANLDFLKDKGAR